MRILLDSIIYFFLCFIALTDKQYLFLTTHNISPLTMSMIKPLRSNLYTVIYVDLALL